MTSIPDESLHAFVAECLAEAPVTGECTQWASGNSYWTMPNWDTSLISFLKIVYIDLNITGTPHLNKNMLPNASLDLFSSVKQLKIVFLMTTLCLNPLV